MILDDLHVLNTGFSQQLHQEAHHQEASYPDENNYDAIPMAEFTGKWSLNTIHTPVFAHSNITFLKEPIYAFLLCLPHFILTWFCLSGLDIKRI